MATTTQKIQAIIEQYHALVKKEKTAVSQQFKIPTMYGEVVVTPLSEDELDNLDDTWEAIKQPTEEEKTIYKEVDKYWLEFLIMVHKGRLTTNNYFYGLKSPSSGIVVREPIPEDLCGATSVNWGPTNWGTAGLYGWLTDGAIAADTLANEGHIILKDSEDDIWSWLWMGNYSLMESPKAKAAQMYLDQNPQSFLEIRKRQLRSKNGLADFDSPILITSQPFKVGLEIATGYTGNDYQIPKGWVCISTKRSRDASVDSNRPTASG